MRNASSRSTEIILERVWELDSEVKTFEDHRKLRDNFTVSAC